MKDNRGRVARKLCIKSLWQRGWSRSQKQTEMNPGVVVAAVVGSGFRCPLSMCRGPIK